MGRGPVVEKKKNLSNAAKQKVFTIHAKLISIAAEKGGDPDKNPSLQDAIEKARKDNVPNENILRAIKKGTGEDKSGEQITQIMYEGYGPGGVAIIVSTLTDNKNRTASNIRHIFSKYGGNMGEHGSVSFVFELKGFFSIDIKKFSKEILEGLVFETEIEDFFEENGYFNIITLVSDFAQVKKFLQSKGIEFEFADLNYIHSTSVKIDDFDKALKLTKMIEAFHEDEDVEKVFVNMDIPETLQNEIEDFINKNKFKT